MAASTDPMPPLGERQLRLTRPYCGRLATVVISFGGVGVAAAVVQGVGDGDWAVVLSIPLLAVMGVALVNLWSQVIELGSESIGFGSAVRAMRWMAVEDVRLVVSVAIGNPAFPLRRGMVLLGIGGGTSSLGHRMLIRSLGEDAHRQVAAAERANGPLGSLFIPVKELDEKRRMALRAWVQRALPAPHAERALVMVDSGRR